MLVRSALQFPLLPPNSNSKPKGSLSCLPPRPSLCQVPVLHIELSFHHHSYTAQTLSCAPSPLTPLSSPSFSISDTSINPQVLFHSTAPWFSLLIFWGDLTFKYPSYHFLISNKSIIGCDYLFWLYFDCFLSLLAMREWRQLSICSCFHIFILSPLKAFTQAAITSLSTFAHL